MPLQQAVTDKSGVVSDYWVVTNIHADMVNQSVSVTLAGWLNQTTYAAGSQASARRPFFFSIAFSALPTAATGSISLDEVYTALLTIINDPKKKSPLAGAALVA